MAGRTLPLLLLAALPASFAAEPEWAALNREARQALEKKDYTKLRSTLERLRPLMPGNLRVLYNLAACDSVLGDHPRALARLADLAAAGLVLGLAADDDFRPLRRQPEYDAVLRRMERNRLPGTRATEVHSIAGQDLLPEDIAYDTEKRVFLVASATGAKILRVGGEVFAAAPWPVMALRIDPKRRILWAAVAWLPHCASCRAEDKDRNALLSYRLDSGALIARYDSPVPGVLGDMTIGPDGELYVSEGLHGAVFRFWRGRFERLDPPGEFPSPQTPALSPDGRTLYIPDYVRGIAALDLKTRQVRWLQPAAGIVTSGIDGLYVEGSSFIAVQNGVTPPRIVRFSLDLNEQEILEANTPGLGEPTHGVLAGGAFYFVANTGWPEYGDDGRKKPGSAPVVSSIRKINLRASPQRPRQ